MAGQRQRNAQGHKQHFKKVPNNALHKLKEAGISGREMLVYCALTYEIGYKPNGYVCRRSRKAIADELGLTENDVKSIMGRLRKREFEWNGWRIPIVELIRSGYSGHTSEYRDNLTAYARHPDKDPGELLGPTEEWEKAPRKDESQKEERNEQRQEEEREEERGDETDSAWIAQQSKELSHRLKR